jgi:hypothetical protein
MVINSIDMWDLFRKEMATTQSRIENLTAEFVVYAIV